MGSLVDRCHSWGERALDSNFNEDGGQCSFVYFAPSHEGSFVLIGSVCISAACPDAVVAIVPRGDIYRQAYIRTAR